MFIEKYLPKQFHIPIPEHQDKEDEDEEKGSSRKGVSSTRVTPTNSEAEKGYEERKTPYECVFNDCSQTFKTEKRLKVHYCLVHYKRKLARYFKVEDDYSQCPICARTFSTLNGAIRHLGITHKKLENFCGVGRQKNDKLLPSTGSSYLI